MCVKVALIAAAGLGLSGCGMFGSWFGGVERDPWRVEAEANCIASGVVQASQYVQPIGETDGPGACGADKPFRVTALAGGTVGMSETAKLNCPMVAALDDWVQRVVQPEAMRNYGQPVTGLSLMGSYTCRRINHRSVGSMSEHAYMNAIDVGGFQLADGRSISVKRGWRSPDPAETGFLHAVGTASCTEFTTVLGPGRDRNHQDHLHLDLANHSRGRHICKGDEPNDVMSYGTDQTSSIGGAAIQDPGDKGE